MFKETLHHNKSQNQECSLVCAQCLIETRHLILHSVDIDVENIRIPYWSSESFQIVQCQGCESISFRRWYSDTENTIHSISKGEQICVEMVEVYPSRMAGRSKIRHIRFLPSNVKQVYEETHSALCNRQQVLAGIGIRALIDAICKEKGAKGWNLQKKIDDLVKLGVLTPTGADILHNLRILGNAAAHEVKPHSEKTLGIAMDIVEHLLNDVYILPRVADRLPIDHDSDLL